jgi:hypothetical protein
MVCIKNFLMNDFGGWRAVFHSSYERDGRAPARDIALHAFWQLLPVFPENGNTARRFDQNQPGQWFGA